MTFVIGKLAWLVLGPSNVLLLALAGGLAAHRWRLGRLVAGSAMSALLLVTLLPVGQWLQAPLEARFPQPSGLAHVDGVIALGGGIDAKVSAHWGQPAIGGTAERFTALVSLGRRWPDARLVFTGGIGLLGGAPATEASILRQFVLALGLDERRLVLEDRSRTTRENALLTRELLQPQPGQVWLLVTSAAHMPRSVGVFRGAGWEVLPWPVDYRTSGWRDADWRFRVGERLTELDEAAYEWAGLVYYRLLGWTPALFPAP